MERDFVCMTIMKMEEDFVFDIETLDRYVWESYQLNIDRDILYDIVYTLENSNLLKTTEYGFVRNF